MTDNNSKKTTVSGGIGFTGLLTIIFIVLKLLNIINWSWWWRRQFSRCFLVR